MIGLVVTGHGHFADGIHTSAQMIAGENDYVRYINFEEGMTPEQLAEKFNAAFDEFKSCDGVVVLSDRPAALPSRLLWSARCTPGAEDRSHRRHQPAHDRHCRDHADMGGRSPLAGRRTYRNRQGLHRRFELEAAISETESEESDGIWIYDDQLGSYHLDLHHAGRAHECHRPHPLRHLG